MRLDYRDINKCFHLKSDIVLLNLKLLMTMWYYFWHFSCIFLKNLSSKYLVISCKYNGIYITAESSDGQHIYFFNKALSYPTHMHLVLVELMYQTVVPFTWVRNLMDELWNTRCQNPNGHGGMLTISPIMESARGWQICNQKEKCTWFPLPGTPGEEYLCHTGKPCQLPQPGEGGGKERETTWPPQPAPVPYQEGLSWVRVLGSG